MSTLRVVVGHPEIHEVVGLAGRDHQDDLVGAVALLPAELESIEALGVRHQNDVRDVVATIDGLQNLHAIGELREKLGVGEARPLQLPDAGGDDPVDHFYFFGRGNDLGDGLEPIAGPALANDHRFWKCHRVGLV